MKGITSVGVFLLIFLVSTPLVAALPSVYLVEIEDDYEHYYDGIYEERSNPTLHYKQTYPDQDFILYRDANHNDTWTFGLGESISTVRPKVRAPASAGEPPSTRWKNLYLGRTFDLKIVEVKSIGANELREKLERGEDVIKEGNILCWGRTKWGTNRPLIIAKDDCRICNLIKECYTGLDEDGCPAYVNPSFELPLYCTLVVLILGLLLYLGWKAVTKAAEEEIRAREENATICRQLEEAVDLMVQAAVEQRPIPESSYDLVHETPGGLEVLVGASFLFSLESAAKHRLALAIKEEEEKRHGKEWRSCVRRKAGSTKASAIFLDSLKPPGCLKKAAFKASEGLRWLSDPPTEEPDTWYGQLWSKAKSRLINGFLPLLKISSFIIDYMKDAFWFAYLFQKRDAITSLFIKHLIKVQGLTILIQGGVTGLMVQFDNNVVDLDSFAYPNYVLIVRILIFVATPVMPVFVILRALRLNSEKRKLEAEWRRNQESICKTYLRCNKLDRKKRKVMAALADMKMVEVSTEAVPQLYIFICFLLALLTRKICFGITEDGDITFIILSLLQTYLTIILSVIGSINLRKGGQLDVKAKLLLVLSLSCQLGARLLVMVFISIMAIDRQISIISAGLLLLLPIIAGWVSSILLHARLNTDFYKLSTKSKLVHLLSTTWFTLPVRKLGERDQRHKGREMTFGCILDAINLVGTAVATVLASGIPEELPIEEKVIGFCIITLPPLLLHLVGCGLLLLFEKTVHPWRQLGQERESHCWGKLQGSKNGIQAEPTLWELVGFFNGNCFYIYVFLQEEHEGGEGHIEERQIVGADIDAGQVYLTFHVCNSHNTHNTHAQAMQQQGLDLGVLVGTSQVSSQISLPTHSLAFVGLVGFVKLCCAGERCGCQQHRGGERVLRKKRSR